jgi:hypothetical protein
MIGDWVRVRRSGDARHGQWAHIREMGPIEPSRLLPGGDEGGVYYPSVTLEFETDGAVSNNYTMKDVIDSDTCFRCGVRLVSSLSRSLHEC